MLNLSPPLSLTLPLDDAATAGCFTVRAHASVAEIPQAVWDRLLPGEPESWSFYRAVEQIPPPGFTLSAMACYRGEEIVAVAPMFRVNYRVDTPFQGTLRRIGDWLYARVPRLVSFPVIGLGSPMSDNCALGFAPELSQAERRQAFAAMRDGLSAEARRHRSALIAVKSLDHVAEELDDELTGGGFNRVTSVPLVMLDLPFRRLDQFYLSLRKKDADYLKRKYRSIQDVRVEWRNDPSGIEDKLNALFAATLAQSKVDYGDFQELHPYYFTRVFAAMEDKCRLMLCWHGDELVSFQFFILGERRALAKQIGMSYPKARDLNLYFVNWMALIEFCIANRIASIEMGATTYRTKLVFGGRLERRWLHYRFRSSVLNRALRGLAPLFDFERNDPELKALSPEKRAGLPPIER